MDLQGKDESQTSLPATSASTEFNSYSTVSTNDYVSSPERIFNLPKSPNVINLPSSGQHINRPYEVPDPNRIPQSIFARSNSKSAQMEWSVTSNESLFSIHVAKPSDLSNAFTDNPENVHMGVMKETLQGLKEGINGPLIETECEHQDGEFHEKLEVHDNLCSTPNLKFNFSALTTPCESPGSGISVLSGQHSETSTHSHNSFAFPVLTKDVKSKSIRNDLMHQLIMKDKSLREPPFPETPIAEKAVPQQNAGWKSYFYCCSFTR